MRKPKNIGGGWWVQSGPQRAYIAAECPHGGNITHSLDGALGCGILDAVRLARGLSRGQLARKIGCADNTIHRWAHATRHPTGKYREELEKWLRGGRR